MFHLVHSEWVGKYKHYWASFCFKLCLLHEIHLSIHISLLTLYIMQQTFQYLLFWPVESQSDDAWSNTDISLYLKCKYHSLTENFFKVLENMTVSAAVFFFFCGGGGGGHKKENNFTFTILFFLISHHEKCQMCLKTTVKKSHRKQFRKMACGRQVENSVDSWHLDSQCVNAI